MSVCVCACMRSSTATLKVPSLVCPYSTISVSLVKAGRPSPATVVAAHPAPAGIDGSIISPTTDPETTGPTAMASAPGAAFQCRCGAASLIKWEK